MPGILSWFCISISFLLYKITIFGINKQYERI